MAQKVFKSPIEQSESLQKKSVGEDLTDFYNKQFFKQANGDRNAFIEHNISRFGIPRGSSKAKEVEHYGQVFDKLAQKKSKKTIDLDIDNFNKVYNKAKTDFPNDWGDKMDYLSQELGLKFPENVADVYYKNGVLYGLQTDPEKEPYEIELYNINPLKK